MNRTERLVLTVAVLASFVAFLDGTVVNVALPAISEEIGGGLAVQQWTVDAYLITLGALILVAGSLSDLLGRVRILRIGLIGFALTSIAIAAAFDPVTLIAARALQGIAGALLVPSSLALITSTFRGAAQGRAIGLWTSFTSVAMIAGPLIGGLFVDLASWRLVFLVNIVPIAVTLWLLGRLGVKDERRPGARVDYLGALLCTLGLGGPVFALIEEPNLGMGHPAIWLPLALGILAFAGFLWRQATASEPMMPLGLFRVRNFWAGNIATALIYAALSLSSFVLVVWLQQGAGLPATLAGLALIPTTIILILLSSRIGALAGRIGPRLFMTVGPIVAGVGVLLQQLVRDDFDYWTQLLPGIVVFGLGIAITVSPLTSAILGSIDAERSGIASAINNAVSRVAGLLAIAMLGLIIGDTLDLEGLKRALAVAALLLILGGLVSSAGIRNPGRTLVPGVDAAPADR